MKKYLIISLILASCSKHDELTPEPAAELDQQKLCFHSSYDHGGGDLLLYVDDEYEGKIRAITPNVTCGDTICKMVELSAGHHTWHVTDYEGNTWGGEIEATDGDCELIDLWEY